MDPKELIRINALAQVKSEEILRKQLRALYPHGVYLGTNEYFRARHRAGLLVEEILSNINSVARAFVNGEILPNSWLRCYWLSVYYSIKRL